MQRFRGQSEHSLDPKGRLNIPARFRDVLREQYDSDTRRRLDVRPGLSGLWQVSGRSNLSWEDTVRLDLYYVDNWSMVQDFMILLRTFRAVVASAGAY